MQSPLFKTSKFENLDDYIANLLNKSAKTLPCLIIKEILERKGSMRQSEIVESIEAQYETLRKPNGAKYGNNIKRVTASTLHSTKLFDKVNQDEYKLNKEEVIKYLERNSINKQNVYEICNKSNDENDFLHKKRIIKKSLSANAPNIKFTHAYEILDEILVKYTNDKKICKDLTNPFAKCSTSYDLLLKIGNKDKIIGMVTCFKLFKPILKKMIFVKSKQSKKAMEKINLKLNNLMKELDFVHQAFENNNNSASPNWYNNINNINNIN